MKGKKTAANTKFFFYMRPFNCHVNALNSEPKMTQEMSIKQNFFIQKLYYLNLDGVIPGLA